MAWMRGRQFCSSRGWQLMKGCQVLISIKALWPWDISQYVSFCYSQSYRQIHSWDLREASSTVERAVPWWAPQGLTGPCAHPPATQSDSLPTSVSGPQGLIPSWGTQDAPIQGSTPDRTVHPSLGLRPLALWPPVQLELVLQPLDHSSTLPHGLRPTLPKSPMSSSRQLYKWWSTRVTHAPTWRTLSRLEKAPLGWCVLQEKSTVVVWWQ